MPVFIGSGPPYRTSRNDRSLVSGEFLVCRGDHSIRRRAGGRNRAAATARPSPGRLTVSSNRASRRLLCRPDPPLIAAPEAVGLFNNPHQALEQFSRRADGRQFAAPRGLDRLGAKAGAELRFTY